MEIIKTKTICDVCYAETGNKKIDIQVFLLLNKMKVDVVNLIYAMKN